MADQHSAPDRSADRSDKHMPGPPVPNWVTPRPGGPATGVPRWVKVFGIIGIVLVLLIIVMLLTGHGPARHMHHGGLAGGVASHVGPPGTLAGITALIGRRP